VVGFLMFPSLTELTRGREPSEVFGRMIKEVLGRIFGIQFFGWKRDSFESFLIGDEGLSEKSPEEEEVDGGLMSNSHELEMSFWSSVDDLGIVVVVPDRGDNGFSSGEDVADCDKDIV
jgi:hypothetical protein